MHTCLKLCKPVIVPLILDWFTEYSATWSLYWVPPTSAHTDFVKGP